MEFEIQILGEGDRLPIWPDLENKKKISGLITSAAVLNFGYKKYGYTIFLKIDAGHNHFVTAELPPDVLQIILSGIKIKKTTSVVMEQVNKIISKWRINKSMLAEEMKMPLGTFKNKLNKSLPQYHFSDTETDQLYAILGKMALDLMPFATQAQQKKKV